MHSNESNRRIIAALRLIKFSLYGIIFAFSLSAHAQSGQVDITGEMRKWHPVTLTLDGPFSSETSDPNPFLDYRLTVTFSNGGTTYEIPGFFAADGDAANTSSTSGSKWRVRFMPDKIGTWTYTIGFREGDNVAVNDSPTAGSPNQFDGTTGTFFIQDTDKSGVDFRGKGVLRHVGEHFLQFDNGEWFMISGTGSPETFLGYKEFDNTFSTFVDYTKSYNSHIQDWNEGDPVWQNSKGKGIIGAINYLSQQGINAQFIVIMNSQGDGQDTFPWVSHEDFFHFDVSKLEQWHIVLQHMNNKGILPQLVLQEMNNNLLLSNGDLGTERRLFYREMIARFGQLNGVQWNIGEEHGLVEDGGNTDAQRLDYINYLTALDVYDHPVIMHTSAGGNNYNGLFGPLLGHPEFGGMSYHIHGAENNGMDTGGGPNTYKYAREWREASANNGRKWVITLDECCGWNTGVRPDQSNIDPVRKDEMWGLLMAGATGFHWYLGFEEELRDLTLEDLRTYQFLWDATRHAKDFFFDYVPFHETFPVDGLTPTPTNRVLAKPGEVYVIHLRDGGNTSLNLDNHSGTFSVEWYNPRSGGSLITSNVTEISGSGFQPLGNPPSDPDNDWVILVRNKAISNVASLDVTPNPIGFTVTPVDETTSFSASLENTGNAALSITSVSLTGTDASQFSHDFNSAISINPLATASLNISFTPTSVGNKSAQLTIEHTGTNSPVVVDLSGAASSGRPGKTVLFRVNAGGDLISDLRADWENDRTVTEGKDVADAEQGSPELGDPHPYVNAFSNGDWTWGMNDPIAFSSTVPSDTPEELFQVGRWDPSDNPLMEWDIPVEAGSEIEVRLYFSEIRFNSSTDPDGPRIFSVLIDGFSYPGFSDINLLEEAGHDTGIMKSAIIVSDGNVDIDFVNQANDPIIMGIEIIALGTLSRAVANNWNLVGIPTNTPSTSHTSVFNELNLLTEPYVYQGGTFTQVTEVEPGKGIWIKTASVGNQTFEGDPVESVTWELEAGWNMVSGPGCTLPLTAASDPSTILLEGTLYGYRDAYQQESNLYPGFGYWIRTDQPGTITLNCNTAGKERTFSSTAPSVDHFGILTISDSGNDARDLYFGGDLADGISRDRYGLPPRLSSLPFDVRFRDNNWLTTERESVILLQAEQYPLTVYLKKTPAFRLHDYVMQTMSNDGIQETFRLEPDTPIELSDASISALKLMASGSEEAQLPETFRLHGNYPNPFNPSTQIRFDLPEAALVQVSVYDVLGRQVLSTPARFFSPGSEHRIAVEANELASGTYIYHVRAETEERTITRIGRMTLIK